MSTIATTPTARPATIAMIRRIMGRTVTSSRSVLLVSRDSGGQSARQARVCYGRGQNSSQSWAYLQGGAPVEKIARCLSPVRMLLVDSPLSLRGGGAHGLSGRGYAGLADLADLALSPPTAPQGLP